MRLISHTMTAWLAVPLVAALGGELPQPPAELLPHFSPPERWRQKPGDDHPVLCFEDGSTVEGADDWAARRREILAFWHRTLGEWPPLIESPATRLLEEETVGSVQRQKLAVHVGLGGEAAPGFLMIPEGEGPFPAVLVVYYDAESGAGLGVARRDFGLELARRGFVTLSVGPPRAGYLDSASREGGARRRPYLGPRGRPVAVQPLSALAYAAANCHTVLAEHPLVDPQRIGVMGHSFGGKWAMFASCLYEKFACGVWSDPGLVFDERDRRKQNPHGAINYWDRWYLGFPLGQTSGEPTRFEFRGRPGPDNPRTGSYKSLYESGHDLVELHALMAPRPFFVMGGTADRAERWAALNHAVAVNRVLGYRHRVAMANRSGHAPTRESNAAAYRFLAWCLEAD